LYSDQTATSHECCSAPRQRHTQVHVRPWTVTLQLLHVDLHWLDVADRVKFKLGLTVHRCLSNKAPHYLADSFMLVSNIASRQRLRSAHRRHLDVPRHNRKHTWPSVILCRRSYRVEFASRRSPRSMLYRKLIQTVTEDIPFRAAIVCRAL